MDIKPFIDKFDGISHLPRDKQFDLLTQAVVLTNKQYRFAILELAPQIIRLLFILLFAWLSYTFFDVAMWAFITGIVLALICSRIVIFELTNRLLISALNKIGAETPSKSE